MAEMAFKVGDKVIPDPEVDDYAGEATVTKVNPNSPWPYRLVDAEGNDLGLFAAREVTAATAHTEIDPDDLGENAYVVHPHKDHLNPYIKRGGLWYMWRDGASPVPASYGAIARALDAGFVVACSGTLRRPAPMPEPTEPGTRVEVDGHTGRVVAHRVQREDAGDLNWVVLDTEDQTYTVWTWAHLATLNPVVLGND